MSWITAEFSPRSEFIRRLATATAIAGAALALQWILAPRLGEFVQLPGLAAITISALLGFWPGVAAAAILLIGEQFLFHPGAAKLIEDGAENLIITGLGGVIASARRRAALSAATASVLETQMLEIAETERRQIGHDLHDGLGQQLTGVALLTESLAHRLSTRCSSEAPHAEQIGALVSESIRWTRMVARGLSPLTLDAKGLAAALGELCTNAETLFQISCRLDPRHADLSIDDAHAVHVYRIVQEAISNSVKHGKAKRVDVSVARDESRLKLTILDDGIGISEKTIAHPGIGLRIMKYRANLIGATLTLAKQSARGGAIVTVLLNASPSVGK